MPTVVWSRHHGSCAACGGAGRVVRHAIGDRVVWVHRRCRRRVEHGLLPPEEGWRGRQRHWLHRALRQPCTSSLLYVSELTASNAAVALSWSEPALGPLVPYACRRCDGWHVRLTTPLTLDPRVPTENRGSR